MPRFPGTKHSRGADDDYVIESWSLKGAWLQHGWGPWWSGGLPGADTLAALTNVEERDVRESGDADLLGAAVADVRGARPNGRRYRFVGRMGETYEYDNATPEAAALFDRMLDAMCRVPPRSRGTAKR